ncbi:hypothetical protein Fleli_3974 [Bernardetia litoralis DSM 6794]|uniref:Uncharacterized protein n=1 Tax=Bernardetia litoralis (strain ATCC 23117 / DSM 6794 / NBRC 15988 / NCIMB 1366 / Fx l1 / Sio-4) TaxID=880071 RepID=I4AQP1_BERLS|nr:hypothetical protein [Bernardetia litoralis]AFM06276.1 hypothetical protein Fleli_3974 [Bernardetia litoralis DSM 6794]
MRFLLLLLPFLAIISTKTVFAQTDKNDTKNDSLNSTFQKIKWIAVQKKNNSAVVGVPTNDHYTPYTAFWTKEIDSLPPISIQVLQTRPALSSVVGVPTNNTNAIKATYDFEKQIILFDSISNQTIQLDSIQISYQSIPFKIKNWNFKRSQEEYEQAAMQNFIDTVDRKAEKKKIITEERQELFSSNLQKSGSITRGVSVGNQQDVFVNSNLNLQLEGKLTDEIELTAIISDQNVPFQPEGNTQQIQQFDRIQIQLRHKNASLTAGDVTLKQGIGNNSPHFMRFYKNVLGGVLQTNFQRDSTFSTQQKISLAAAKGQFQSYQLPVQEGVQGAYRLVGANNESFIIVQAGSEKVFLDGQLLQRGFNYDYIIDYNTAEITFNPHVVITQFSRVRVEFEYTNQYYNRTISNLGASVNFTSKNKSLNPNKLKKSSWNVFIENYSESDNEKQPINFDISEERQTLLENIGDSLSLAVVESAEEAEGFSINQILYIKKDTLINSFVYPIFVRATQDDENQTLYTISFSEVEQNQGDYSLGETLANGNEYVFVGINQGNYAPIRQLPAPNSKELTNAGIRFSPNKHTSIFAETAFSKQDKNLFSEINSEDDQGNAFFIGIHTKEKIVQNKYKLSYGIDYEIDNKNFEPIDRFRDIEFDRDWTLPTFYGSLPNGKDQILQAFAIIENNQSNKFEYHFTYREREDAITGQQHKILFNKKIGKLQLSTNGFLLTGENKLEYSNSAASSYSDLTSTTSSENSIISSIPSSQVSILSIPQTVFWLRYDADLKYQNRFIIPAYSYSIDKQEFRQNIFSSITNQKQDSVTSSLINYEQHKFYLFQGDSSKKANYKVEYILREDFLPKNGNIQSYTNSQTAQAEATLNFEREKSTQKLTWNATYRNLKYNQEFLDTIKLENTETLMGRIDWRSDFFERAIHQELTYSTVTGREPALEFTFIGVDGTQGTHTWRDDNNDGVQQLGEFYEAINADERNYIKIFTPTSTYLTAFSTDFVYKITLTPPRKWKKAKFIKKSLQLFSLVFSVQNSVKTTENDFAKRFIPFAERSQENILSEQSSLRNVLFLNRTNPKWGGEFRYTSTRQKTLLAGGFDSQNIEEYEGIFRLSLSKTIASKSSFLIGKQNNASDYLENRTYDLELIKPQIELSWQPTTAFRLTTAYRFENKKNTLGIEKATINEFRTELRYSKVGDRVFNLRLRTLNIDFTGETNTPVSYELLEALQAGQNLTWDLSLQQKLFNGLQLSVVYEGRKSGSNAAVHIGRIQVTALF